MAIGVLPERACFLLQLGEGGSYMTLLTVVLPMLFFVELLVFVVLNQFCFCLPFLLAYEPIRDCE